MREVILSEHLKQEVSQLTHAAKQSISLSIVFIILGIILTLFSLTILGIGFFVIAFILFFVALKNLNKKNIFQAGLEGEERLKKTLNRILSDKYTAFFGYQTKKGKDIDCIVTGPKGVFVIEVKNHRGIVSYDGKNWSYLKVGKKGGIYEGFLKNPDRQVIQNSAEIRKLLFSNGIKVPVFALLVFTHEEVKLNISEFDNKKFRILRLEELPQFFEPIPERLKNETVEKINRLIEEKGK
ncbi:MAG: nuclease-related domain-containing protein [Caldimicrobium sp.]